MVKGGFQGLDISGVDLTAQSPTLPGAYAACAGADGKPIRVQTADGQVECSVKKVSTNYVLAGVTGDGKILSITIGSTDGISVIETEIPSAEVYLDNAIDISTVTSADPYTTEYDGIVRLRRELSTTISSTPIIMVKTGAAQTSNNPLMTMSVETPATHVLSCFVKKGTALYGSNIAEGVISAKFLPYKPVES